MRILYSCTKTGWHKRIHVFSVLCGQFVLIFVWVYTNLCYGIGQCNMNVLAGGENAVWILSSRRPGIQARDAGSESPYILTPRSVPNSISTGDATEAVHARSSTPSARPQLHLDLQWRHLVAQGSGAPMCDSWIPRSGCQHHQQRRRFSLPSGQKVAGLQMVIHQGLRHLIWCFMINDHFVCCILLAIRSEQRCDCPPLPFFISIIGGSVTV